MFLTMMSEHLFEFDAEAELVDAFSSFDESDSGTVRCDEIRKWLSETGDRMSQSEVCIRSSLLQSPMIKWCLSRSIGF